MVAFVGSIVMLVSACGAPTAPTPVRSTTPTLTIVPALDVLRVGQAETFTAVLLSGDGTQRWVDAAWTSDAPTVAAINSDGTVSALSPGAATIRATFQQYRAELPLQIVPDVKGTWVGTYRVADCRRVSGAGPSYCRFVIGSVMPVRLILDQSADEVSGTLELYTNTNDVVESGAVSGQVHVDATLTLEGTTKSVDPAHQSETTISNWNTQLTEDLLRMTGRFTQNRTFYNAWGLQKSREDCEVTRLERTEPLAR